MGYKIRLAEMLIFFLIAAITCSAQTDQPEKTIFCDSLSINELLLESHEPNRIGLTVDDDDVLFMDFTVSMKYPVMTSFVDWLNDNLESCINISFCRSHRYFPNSILPTPYFSFTGRFGQYIGTRNSAPVVGKRFNPTLFFRYELGKRCEPFHHLDLIYGHESNGQAIEQLDQYKALQAKYVRNHEDVAFADDFISRGWDYVGLTYRNMYFVQKTKRRFAVQFHYRYFLKNGLLQGKPEEYKDWEHDSEGKPRTQVDGLRLSLIFSYIPKPEHKIKYVPFHFKGYEFLTRFQTGYDDIFTNNTYRVEFTVNVSNLPLTVWLSYGYSNDLALYYKNVSSCGIAFQLESFWGTI